MVNNSNEPEHMCKLFIGGLDHRTTDETLKSHFEKFGEIVDVIVMKDPQTKRSRGFGFVAFSQSYMVDEAQKARPHNIDGRDVDTKRAVPRDQIGKVETGSSKKLFIGGIKDLTEDDIRDAFGQYGEVSSVAVPTDRETGNKRGFAFVEFTDNDSADKAVLQARLMILDTEVDVRKARGKEAPGGGRGGRGGGRGGYGGGRDGGYRGGSQGGYGGNQGGYGGGSQGGYGGQGGYNQGYGGGYSQGGYDQNQSGGYGQTQSWGSGGYGQSQPQQSWGQSQSSGFGSYDQSYGGGPTRNSSGYGQQRSTPYAGGAQGGSYGGGSQGGYGGGSQGGYGGGRRY